MSWMSVLPAALLALVMLSRCGASSAAPRGPGGGGGGGGGGGERSAKLLPRAHPRLAARARHLLDEDFSLDEDEFAEAPKRTYSDYGHMRFGKRDMFDDYGHMRFGRADY